MTIYIDVIFAENMIMNYIILYATGVIYKEKIKLWRNILASLIGTFYAIMLYLQIWNANSILKILLSIVMVYIAFYPKSFKNLIKQIAIFYLASFLFGGIAIALMYFVKPQDILMKNGIYIGTYPLKIVLLGSIIGFILVKIVTKIIKGKIHKNDLMCEITIVIEGMETRVKAMLDTGNTLKDPITRDSVIVVEKEALERYNTSKNFKQY